MSSILFDNHIVADVRVLNIYGSPGIGVYRLVFDIRFDLRSADEAAKKIIRNISSEIFIARKGQSKRQKIYLGKATPEETLILKTPTRSINKRESLTLDLSKHQIDLIEELRNGEELNFYINLSSEVIGNGEYKTDSARLSYFSNKSTWLNALGRMGYGEFLLFEIPIPDNESLISEKIFKNIKIARDQFVKGNYEHALAKCRFVQDRLTEFLGDEDEVKKADKLYSSNNRRCLKRIVCWQFEILSVILHIWHIIQVMMLMAMKLYLPGKK